MTSPTIVEVLKKARALLEKGWTRGQFARDAAGAQVSYESDYASCFCIDGAMLRVGAGTEEYWSAYYLMCDLAKEETGDPFACIIGWNDAAGRTQSEVLDLMDRAIALAEQREESRV